MISMFKPHVLRIIAKNISREVNILNPARGLATLDTTYGSADRGRLTGPYGSYEEEFSFAASDPIAFWARNTKLVDWYKEPQKILEYDERNPLFYKWFPDGELNLAYNCLDRHLDERGDQDALVYDSPVIGKKERWSYRKLAEEVATFAGGLQDSGIKKGDTVVIYMPMIPQAIVAILACARIGAIHSIVFGGFAAPELAARISHATPKAIITAAAGIEGKRIIPYKPLVDEALSKAKCKVGKVIMVQRPDVIDAVELHSPTEISYDDLMAKSRPVEAVPVSSNHLQHIMYTSGTTGHPKGIVRDVGGCAVMTNYSMGAFYNMSAGEVFWTASDIGWIVGSTYSVYGPLMQGCTSVIYEGKPVGTPDAGAFWRIIEEYGVKSLFVAPTAIRAVKQADPNAELISKYDLSCFQNLFLAGEHCDPDTLHYFQRALSKYGAVKNAIDHWWQTELGGPAIGNAVGLGRAPLKEGACSGPAPGWDARVLRENGSEANRNELGAVAIKTPLPPGCLTTLYKDDQRYIDTYLKKFPGFYDTSDTGFIDEDGYIHLMGRVDDVINVSGHRLSTGEMEEILMEHPDVAECAVFPCRDELKGHVPMGLVITNKGSTISPERLKKELIQSVRDSVGAIACFKKVEVVEKLPKTRSGKILRGTMSKIADGKDYIITPTVEDATVFDHLEPVIQNMVEKNYSS